MDAGNGQTAFKLMAAPDRLELLLPCVLFGVRSHREPLMAEVAMNLDFAPRLHAAAKRITGGQCMTVMGPGERQQPSRYQAARVHHCTIFRCDSCIRLV